MKQKQHHSERDDQRFGQTSLGEPEPQEANRKPMKCVWSGFPDYNRDCRSRIPASIVIKAWHREIQLKDAVEGFFYFSWRNGVWLAYGLREGGVRGVYCPTHCSERNVREAQNESPGQQDDDLPGFAREDPQIRRVVGSQPEGEPARTPRSGAPVAWPAYAVGRSSL
jgi:hypothetical protein